MNNADENESSSGTRLCSIPSSERSSSFSRTVSENSEAASGPSPKLLTGSRFDVLMKGNEAFSQVRSSTAANRHPKGLASKPETNPTAAPGASAPLEFHTKPPYKRLRPQPFSHILVCDFEATCESGSVGYPHEIIEFPVVVLDTATLRRVAEFHAYVRPVKNAKLTSFCTGLTGITQAMVDAADPLPRVVERFNAWLRTVVFPLCVEWRARYGAQALSRNLASEQKRFSLDDRTAESRACVGEERMVCFATDGPWDMRRFMHECSVLRDGVDFPPVCYRYINVRQCFERFLKTRQTKLTNMLKRLGMHFVGHPHSGIDDAQNIARVLAELLARGHCISHVNLIKYARNGPKYTPLARELLQEEEFKAEKRLTVGRTSNDQNSNNPNNRTSKGKNARRRRN